MTPFSLEQIIENAKKQGWDFLDGMSAEQQEKLEIQQKLSEEDRKAIASAWADFARTPGGRKALDAMFDMTLRRTTYFVDLGQEVMSMAVFGAFREGQNALAHEIARQIAAGQNEEVKPRDR